MNPKNFLPYLTIVLVLLSFLLVSLAPVSGIEQGETEFDLTKLERMQMGALQLNEGEMRKYLVLKNTYQGFLDVDNLNAYELLGILSTDPAKQREYARRAARFQLSLMNRLKAYEAIYIVEMQKLDKANQSTPQTPK